MKKIAAAQFIILLAGTLFAWFNFAKELSARVRESACTAGCAAGVENNFFTPCFFGAIFFTAAFALSGVIFKKIN